MTAMRPDQVLVKLYFTNAFNTLRRDAMLEAVYTAIPEIYHFALLSYSAPSNLKFGYLSLSSQVGPQQVAGLEPRLGLHLNPAKCEIILGSKAEIPLPFSDYIETQMDGLCLLEAPIIR